MQMIVPLSALCSVLILIAACSDSSDDRQTPAVSGLAPEAIDRQQSGDVTVSATLDGPLNVAEEAVLVTAIRERTAADGVSYEFDAMEPHFTDLGDSIELTFRYLADNTLGGTPIAVISRGSGEIVSIRYTR